jgi:universal stress protein A
MQAVAPRPTVPTLNRILVPIDFSPSSKAALEYATFLAGAVGSQIEVLHVWEPAGSLGPDTVAMLPVSAGRASWEQTRADVRRDVDRFLQQSGIRGVALQVAVEAGEPSEAILATSRKSGADLIVMGTHGRTGLSRLLLGSVAEAVLRRSSCPVLTIRIHHHRQAPPV